MFARKFTNIKGTEKKKNLDEKKVCLVFSRCEVSLDFVVVLLDTTATEVLLVEHFDGALIKQKIDSFNKKKDYKSQRENWAKYYVTVFDETGQIYLVSSQPDKTTL